MHKFHAHLATLNVSRCITCLKGFPGLQLHSRSIECLHCTRDKHVPKLYSSTNIMDPGPVPSQLEVDVYVTHSRKGDLSRTSLFVATGPKVRFSKISAKYMQTIAIVLPRSCVSAIAIRLIQGPLRVDKDG